MKNKKFYKFIKDFSMCMKCNIRLFCFILYIEAIAHIEKQNINEENHENNKDGVEDWHGNDDYDDMVNRMLENKSSKGTKQKTRYPTKRTKRFKRGKTKK